MHRSEVGGQALLAHAQRREGLVDRSGSKTSAPVSKTPCGAVRTRAGQPVPRLPAILTIPAIGLEAPVLQGVGASVLSEAVGHDRASVWPGSPGTSLLLAHDASYFSSLGSVHTGDQVAWIDDCREVVFRVDRVEITRPGAILAPSANGIGVALVTCWPTNALFWTPDRLVVLASFAARAVDSTENRRPTASPRPRDSGAGGGGVTGAAAVAKRTPRRSSTPDGQAQSSMGGGRRSVTCRPPRLQGARRRQAHHRGREPKLVVRPCPARGAHALRRCRFPETSTPSSQRPGTRVSAVTLASPSATVSFVVRSGTLYIAKVQGRSRPLAQSDSGLMAPLMTSRATSARRRLWLRA